MTRNDYIRRTLSALCGESPARPDVYYHVVRMAEEAEAVRPFDKASEKIHGRSASRKGDACQRKNSCSKKTRKQQCYT